MSTKFTKKIISVICSAALLLTLAGTTLFTTVSAAVSDDVWCYIGANGTATGKTYTKDVYNDGTAALKAAFDDASKDKVTLTGNPSLLAICINKDITLTEQLTYSGTQTLRIQNTGYTLTAPEGSTAIKGNGGSLFLYGNLSAVSDKKAFVASSGNAFFENFQIQFGYNIAGDLSVKDCKYFKPLGGKSNSVISGDLIFTGTFDFTDIDNITNGVSYESSSTGVVVQGNYDYSTVTGSSCDFTALTKSPKYFKVNGLVISNDAGVETTDAIKTIEGASIRLNSENGIRFYSTYDASKVPAGYEVVGAGTLISPKDKVNDAGYGVVADKVDNIDVSYNLDNGLYNHTDGNKYVVGSIVKVKAANITREFVARGYLKLKNTTTGKEKVVYSATTSKCRSLQSVATAAQADSDFYGLLDTTQKGYVDTWAAGNAVTDVNP